jgi:hypothetical protein
MATRNSVVGSRLFDWSRGEFRILFPSLCIVYLQSLVDDRNSDAMVLECGWPQPEERPLRRKL